MGNITKVGEAVRLACQAHALEVVGSNPTPLYLNKIMNINYLISDSIARIKNGYMKSYISVSIIKSKFIMKFIQSLENEGFIQGYVEENTL